MSYSLMMALTLMIFFRDSMGLNTIKFDDDNFDQDNTTSIVRDRLIVSCY